MCTQHTLIHSCEGFIELGHEHKNKPTHAEEIVKALGEGDRQTERESKREIERYIALKQRNSLLRLFQADRQKSAPSRLSAQLPSKAEALSTVISSPVGSRV